jgi:hypothetical protein
VLQPRKDKPVLVRVPGAFRALVVFAETVSLVGAVPEVAPEFEYVIVTSEA